MTPDIFRLTNQTRRHLLQTAGLGIGSMALQALLATDKTDVADESKESPKGVRAPMLAPRAKRVIYLHMAGSPSQLELFEHKPDLQKLHMQDCPASFLEGKRFAFIKGVPKILAGQFSFAQYGESGQWIRNLSQHARFYRENRHFPSHWPPHWPTVVERSKNVLCRRPVSGCR